MNRNAAIKITVLLLLILTGAFLFYHYNLYSFFLSRRRIIAFIESFGPLSVLIFIGLQILQVIVAPIPGEISGFIGGYLYGPLLGTLYSTIGLTLGSWLAFSLAHWLGLPFVERVVDRKVIDKYDHFMQHRGSVIALILFLIPGFPKDALSYIIGLSHMKLTTFLVVSTVGRLFGTVMLSVSGSFASKDDYVSMVTLLLLSALVVLLAYLYHEEILVFIKGKKSH
jgi:uncharacterized membrane protein YdjX (TVP38/TMEM64 family)